MNIRCIIMASGKSSRMGKNKLAIKIGEKTILDYVMENIKNSKLSDIVVVYGKYKVETDLPSIYNPDFELGMSTSIIAGLNGFEGDGIMIVLGDMPFIKSVTIDKMLETCEKSSKGIIIPCIKGERGNPVLIKKRYFNDLRNNKGDKGAREIIKNNFSDVERCEVDDKGILIDIDDENTLNMYIDKFEI
jgi:molybdenum cofactor cytidylyltransferase